ncbi:hypothetical protein CYLTODRAFT_480834 [Cylindrobasidium torrendii FP15055 ss-10]|uniref:Uncharacterized protein n=1 Tax=Cylindrobasidium torrendii FP15055 ss-10 TaxID=1314674 RepID=A0A0D7BDZ3_9AGAR|nr:hypothetical protein CYLTODRAFT_480834 [Cylindrobasidium torrendii FP15055 ss-10]
MSNAIEVHDSSLISLDLLKAYFTCARRIRLGQECGYQKPGPCVECCTHKQRCDRGEGLRVAKDIKNMEMLLSLTDSVKERKDEQLVMARNVRKVVKRLGKKHARMLKYYELYMKTKKALAAEEVKAATWKAEARSLKAELLEARAQIAELQSAGSPSITRSVRKPAK